MSTSNLPKVIAYIAGQREHHANQTIENEFRALLTKHGVPFDEQYLLG